MIVVSNTSPVTNLAAIGQFELLRLLYEEVHIPSAVWDELNAEGRSWPGREAVVITTPPTLAGTAEGMRTRGAPPQLVNVPPITRAIPLAGRASV